MTDPPSPPAAKKSKLDEKAVAEEQAGKKPPPLYGSQVYWEKRYKKQRKMARAENTTARVDESESSNNKDDDDDDIDPLPYHAWYFTYEELRPLILPLVLGGRGKAATILLGPDVSEDDQDDDDDGPLESTTEQDESDDSGADEEDDAKLTDEGLAQSGPISILEVGCGDMPLGKELAIEFDAMASTTGTEAGTIVDRIVCCDYSDTVIEIMKGEQSDDTRERTALIVDYVVADARKLQFANESFHFLLEKGTLDAMLSDKEVGAAGCRQIIAECARVLKTKGCIMIVSHVNAHTQNGLDWLEKVVIPGLREGGGMARWSIEVHGSDGSSECAEVEESDANDEESVSVEEDARGSSTASGDVEDAGQERTPTPSGSPGPAVYMIHKETPATESGSGDTQDPPSVPLSFYSY